MRKLYLAVLVLLLLSPGLAQVGAAKSNAVAFSTKGAFFALSVADLKASTGWYTEKFGLTVVQQMPRNKDGIAVAILEGGGLIVELIERNDAQPLAKAAPGVKDSIPVHGIFKAGIIVDDFDSTLATLKARNVEIAYGPFKASAQTKRPNVILKDDDGNLIQL